jgi:hypothetical protein
MSKMIYAGLWHRHCIAVQSHPCDAKIPQPKKIASYLYALRQLISLGLKLPSSILYQEKKTLSGTSKGCMTEI